MSSSDLDRVQKCTREPFVLEGREFFVTASIGIALSPQDGNELSQLMKNADTALHRAKEQGLGRKLPTEWFLQDIKN